MVITCLLLLPKTHRILRHHGSAGVIVKSRRALNVAGEIPISMHAHCSEYTNVVFPIGAS